MQWLLTALGAGTNDVLAAFLGSVCGAFMLTKPPPRAIVSTVFIGTCVGIYFGPNAPVMIGLKPANWITFVIGSIGTALLLAAGKWLKGKFFEGGPK
jgi:hypothetical protein